MDGGPDGTGVFTTMKCLIDNFDGSGPRDYSTALLPKGGVQIRRALNRPAEAELALLGLADFVVQSSPRTHESRLNCPLFLFHAEDDSNVPVEDSRDFASRLKQAGKDVTFVTVPTGDHYDSMIEEGIPKAIAWLKTKTGK